MRQYAIRPGDVTVAAVFLHRVRRTVDQRTQPRPVAFEFAPVAADAGPQPQRIQAGHFAAAEISATRSSRSGTSYAERTSPTSAGSVRRPVGPASGPSSEDQPATYCRMACCRFASTCG